MTNGFYNTKEFTNNEIWEIIMVCIGLSYNVQIQYLEGVQRQTDKTKSIHEYLEELLEQNSKYFTIVDRRQYSPTIAFNQIGEVCLSANSKFLYCYMSLENLAKLIEMYNLKLIEI